MDDRTFKALLEKAIGPSRTKAQFAQEAGISKEHLSRMLNEGGHRPSKQTLSKIAGAAFGGNVKLSDLFRVCDYNWYEMPEKQTNFCTNEEFKKIQKDADERCKRESLKVMGNIIKLIESEEVFLSLADFINKLQDMPSYEDEVFSVMNTKPMDKNICPVADYITEIQGSFADINFECSFGFVIFWCMTISGKVIVNNVVFDYKSLKELKTNIAFEAEALAGPEDEPDLLKTRSMLYVTKIHVRPFETPEQSRENNENFIRRLDEYAKEHNVDFTEALSGILFGDNHPKRLLTVEGFGFYTDNVKEKDIRNFFQIHKDSFCRTDKEFEMFRCIENGEPLDKVFENYEVTSKMASGCDTWECGVANVMQRETGITFDYHYDSDNIPDKQKSRRCVMFAETAPWFMNDVEKNLTRSTINGIIKQYSKDLRLKKEDTGECFVSMFVDAD